MSMLCSNNSAAVKALGLSSPVEAKEEDDDEEEEEEEGLERVYGSSGS
jgi:hypothetical protein